jgi:hypothetical protein
MDQRASEPSPVLRAAFLWGSLWGSAEATLGYLLHLVRVPGLPGLLMAPVAVFAMGRAYRRTGRLAAIPAAALVAALLKLGVLAFPGIDFLAVVNPVRAILLESLAVLGLAAAFGQTFGLPASVGALLYLTGPRRKGRS